MKIICASETTLNINVRAVKEYQTQENSMYPITLEHYLVVLLDNKKFYYGFMSDLFAENKYSDIILTQYKHNRFSRIPQVYYEKDTRVFNRYYLESSCVIMCYGYLTESSLEKAQKWFLKTSLVES